MLNLSRVPSAGDSSKFAGSKPHVVIGFTHSQTCLTLTGRLRALREAGFRVTVISSPGPLLDRIAAAEDVTAVPLSMSRGFARLGDIVTFFGLLRLLKQLKPDLVEFSTPKAGLLGMIAARICRVRKRIYLLRGLKLEGSAGFRRRILLMAERISAACAHVVLCNSESLRAEALSLGIATRSKLRMLGSGSTNGVDTLRFSPGRSDVRNKLGIPRRAPVIGFVGRLTRDKGIPELLAAFEKILDRKPQAHLLLVGWFDSSEDALDPADRAVILTHPRIRCTGFVPDAAPYYRAMNVMALPTWREGFPNVVLEAAATGIPVVTTICTGSRDSVIPEVTGLLIPPGHPEAICEAVMKLLSDTLQRRRMGRAARTWVVRQYGYERVLSLVTAYYRSLLAQAEDSAGPAMLTERAAARR